VTPVVVYRLTDTGARPLTVNVARTLHHQTWGTRNRETRGRWHYLALEAKVPRLERIAVEVLPLHADRRSPQDVAACAPAAKAAIDGLVDAGVLADDDAPHLASITFLPPEVGGVDGMALRFWEVPA
jgi:hypothetical protein